MTGYRCVDALIVASPTAEVLSTVADRGVCYSFLFHLHYSTAATVSRVVVVVLRLHAVVSTLLLSSTVFYKEQN